MKNKISQFFKNIKYCKELPEWIVILVILGFSMFTMFYSDFQGTMDYAYQVTRQIFHGQFSGVPYMMANSYGMTLFTLLVIWMVPFCLFTIPFGEDFWYFGSLGAAIWSKMFLVVVIAFLVRGMVSLTKELVAKENNKWVPLFFLTSAFYFVPVVQIGQCDIIALTFMIWGILYYVRGDTKKFLACFAFAIPMKYFALMIFIPLVLLKEKKTVKIIVQGIVGGSLFFVNLIIRKLVWGTVVGSFTSIAISNMSSTSNAMQEIEEGVQSGNVYVESNAIENFFGTFIANSSVFVIAYILICILAYAIKYDRDKNRDRIWAIYIPALVYSSFFVFTGINVYWTVLVAPFLTILIFCNRESVYCRMGMLLETIAGWALMFVFIFKAAWVVGGEKTFEYLFLKGKTVGSDIHTFLEYEKDFSGLLPYANSAYVACMIALLVLHMPWLINKQETEENEQSFDRWIIWLRIGILLIWVALLVYVLLLHGHD